MWYLVIPALGGTQPLLGPIRAPVGIDAGTFMDIQILIKNSLRGSVNRRKPVIRAVGVVDRIKLTFRSQGQNHKHNHIDIDLLHLGIQAPQSQPQRYKPFKNGIQVSLYGNRIRVLHRDGQCTIERDRGCHHRPDHHQA